MKSMTIKVSYSINQTALINADYFGPLVDFCREAERKIREDHAEPTWNDAYKGFPSGLAADLEKEMRKLYPEGEGFYVYTEDGVTLIEQ